jgi:recombination protein RecA
MASFLNKYPGAGIASAVIPKPEHYLWLPCKSPVINHVMGGGIPYGKMVEFLGEESSGKSLLSYDFIRSAQYLGGVGILVDAEYSFTRSWAETNKLDLDKLHIYQEVAVEPISDFIKDAALHYRSKFTQNEPIVIVVDSLAALDTQEALEKGAMEAKAEMGIRAKAIYRMVRVNNKLLSELGVITIFINQLRDKVGANSMFESSETSPGGRAMRFYAAQRVGLYGLSQITVGTGESRQRVGQNISFRIKKNKVAPPRAPYKTQVIFDERYGEVGFSRFDGLRPILLDLGVVDLKGNSYFFDGDKIATSKADFDAVLEDDKHLRRELLDEAKINTLGRTQEMLQTIDSNRYVVK